MHRIPVVAAATLGLTLVLMTAGCASTSSTSASSHDAVVPTSLFVEGFGVAAASTTAPLRRDAKSLDLVGISGVDLSTGGAGVQASSSDALGLLKTTHREGAKAELVVDNIDASQGDFDASTASAMLSSAENREFVVAGLASEVVNGGYDGIQIDFEALSAADAPGLVTFVHELRSTLPKRASISIALTAATTTAGYRAEGFDLAALSGSTTRFVLMAYDEHGAGFSEAGPVGGLPWARAATTALTSAVSKSKVLLGVAGYGYAWKANGSGDGSLTTAKARARAGSRATWVEAQGEWTAKLADGTVLWWSDGRSLTVRANYAKSIGLRGVALWQVSTGDPITRS